MIVTNHHPRMPAGIAGPIRQAIGLAAATLLLAGCQTVNDAPERGRHLRWSGYEWAVKDEPQPVGPGPNRFSGRSEDLNEAISVDIQ